MKTRNENLANLIKERNLTTTEFAAMIPVNRSTVKRWVNGGNIPPSERREKVASVLGVPEYRIWPSKSIGRRSAASRLVTYKGFSELLSEEMTSARNYIVIDYGQQAQHLLQIDLLLQEITACIERNICVTVRIVNRDTVGNTEIQDITGRKRFLDQLADLQRKLKTHQRTSLHFEGVELTATRYGFSISVDGGQSSLEVADDIWYGKAMGRAS